MFACGLSLGVTDFGSKEGGKKEVSISYLLCARHFISVTSLGSNSSPVMEGLKLRWRGTTANWQSQDSNSVCFPNTRSY